MCASPSYACPRLPAWQASEGTLRFSRAKTHLLYNQSVKEDGVPPVALAKGGGENRIRTYEGISQRIYSPSPLAARESRQNMHLSMDHSVELFLYNINPK